MYSHVNIHPTPVFGKYRVRVTERTGGRGKETPVLLPVDRQTQRRDRVQRRGRDQIAAVQHGFGAARLGVGNCGGEMAAVVVGIRDDADFHGAAIVPNLSRQELQ